MIIKTTKEEIKPPLFNKQQPYAQSDNNPLFESNILSDSSSEENLSETSCLILCFAKRELTLCTEISKSASKSFFCLLWRKQIFFSPL